MVAVPLEYPRPALLAALTLGVLSGDTHDDRLAFLELAAGDLRDAAIGDARGDFARHRLRR